MESKSETTEPNPVVAAASAALIASVLGNDDILREILLRLGFPTSLVCAAAVCKRWLQIASDPAFLRRLRSLHPPRLLGFYVTPYLRFVPRPVPPELASVVRRSSSFRMRRDVSAIFDCRNGRVLTYARRRLGQDPYAICSPLHTDQGLDTPRWSPRPRTAPIHRPNGYAIYEGHRYYITTWGMRDQAMLLPEDGGDGLSCTAVNLMINDNGFWGYVCDMQAGAWGEGRNSNLIDDLPQEYRPCPNFCLLSYGKVYMICRSRHILELDLASMNQTNYPRTRFANWRLVDTICLHQVFGQQEDPTWLSWDAVFNVAAVGDNADFVFLQVQNQLFYMHVSSRAVEKVYELKLNDRSPFVVNPLMMPWPPTFPVMNNAQIQDE